VGLPEDYAQNLQSGRLGISQPAIHKLTVLALAGAVRLHRRMFLARSMVWPTSHGAMACSQCVSCHLDTPAGQRHALSSFNPSQAAVRTFSTTSRPALRAPASGGRPRTGGVESGDGPLSVRRSVVAQQLQAVP
jgi:hypothetical protein